MLATVANAGAGMVSKALSAITSSHGILCFMVWQMEGLT
jgi:uncharacterized membrane protein